MNQVPQVIIADSLEYGKDGGVQAGVMHKGRQIWVKARPASTGGLWTRIKLAFGVFTGKYDALKWVEQ